MLHLDNNALPRVLITGAGSGFGFALTVAFHEAGWQVIALVHQTIQVALLTNYLPDRCYVVQGDVSDESSFGIIANAIKECGGHLSILINNAGMSGGGTVIKDYDFSSVQKLFATHCVGALRCAKACAPFFLENSSNWIINISSRLGSIERNARGEFVGEGRSYAYRVAKAAQNMATVCLAQDPSFNGVKVIAINPGKMETKMGRGDNLHTVSESASILFQRLDSSDFLSGHFYDLYGGEIPW